jgi:hypothetical protein
MSSDIDTRFAYRNLGLAWLVAVLVVPLVLAAALAVARGDKLEDNLRDRSMAALSSAGLSGVEVVFDGRDAALSAPEDSVLTPAELNSARDVVADVDGVRTADLDNGGSGTGKGIGWLIGQLWLLLLLSFLCGSVLTWLIARFMLPNEDVLEADTGVVSEGLL